MEFENFTKKMSSEKVFLCTECEKLLVSPVMMVENVGNFCHSCLAEGQRGVPNTKLELILKSLEFPCAFGPQGCSIMLLYEKLKQHEEDCIHRPIQCVLSINGCNWTGQLADLYKHFTEEHPKDVLNSPLEEFSFDMNLTSRTSFTGFTKVLKCKNKTHILRIKRDERRNSLLHFIHKLENGNGDSEMLAKYVGAGGQLKIPLKPLQFNTDCEEHNAKKIRLSTLQELGESKYDSVKVMIKPKKYESKDLTAQVFKLLECPICIELMRPPIVMCNKGHSFCSSCRKHITQCPLCRQDCASDIRNFALESLVTSVQYPCVYKNFGCTRCFLGADIEKHEGVCEYKVHECPLAPCKFTGDYSSIGNHFTLNHNDHLIQGTTYQSTFQVPSNSSYPITHTDTYTQTRYCLVYNNIYKWIFSSENKYCTWSLQILNTYDDHNVKYFFKITITHPSNPEQQIAQSNSCVNKGDSVTDTNLVSFNYENLTKYKNSTHGEINYSFEIFEQKRH